MDNVEVMISIPEPILRTVDRAALEEQRSRSEFFYQAARFYLQARTARRRPIDDLQVQQAVTLMDQLARLDQPVPDWDTVDAVRAGRERGRG